MDFKDNVKAFDGKQAILAYQQNQFDLVFLDLRMPILNGFNVLTQIKKINPDAYVIIVSGDATAENVKQIYKLGAKGFIVKPCDVDKFSQAIAAFMSAKK